MAPQFNVTPTRVPIWLQALALLSMGLGMCQLAQSPHLDSWHRLRDLIWLFGFLLLLSTLGLSLLMGLRVFGPGVLLTSLGGAILTASWLAFGTLIGVAAGGLLAIVGTLMVLEAETNTRHIADRPPREIPPSPHSLRGR